MATNTQVDKKFEDLEWVNTLASIIYIFMYVYSFFPGPEYQWPNGLKLAIPEWPFE